MLSVELNMFQGLAVAAMVYTIGSVLVKKVTFLSKYCIPAPVVGGLIYAILHLVLRLAGILEISFDSTLQTFFMTIFFTSVGFSASFRLLKKGFKQILLFLGVAILMVVLQNVTGVTLASLFGLDARLGLCVGSIPMVGGHGTAGAYGATMDAMGITGASTVAIAAATFGLISGSMLGGPLARRRIAQRSLHSEESSVAAGEGLPAVESVTTESVPVEHSTSERFMMGAIFLGVAAGVGTLISAFLDQFMTFPSYIGAMVAAAIIRNVWDATHKYYPEEEITVTGSVSLSLFLSFALMGLKLWQLADLAVPMIVMLLAQVVLMAVFAYFIVFNALGHDYDAAVMTTAFCGFGMGATPNAMANMQAVTDKYGPAPRAYFVVPLVGSLFIDFFNGLIITSFLSFLG